MQNLWRISIYRRLSGKRTYPGRKMKNDVSWHEDEERRISPYTIVNGRVYDHQDTSFFILAPRNVVLHFRAETRSSSARCVQYCLCHVFTITRNVFFQYSICRNIFCKKIIYFSQQFPFLFLIFLWLFFYTGHRLTYHADSSF